MKALYILLASAMLFSCQKQSKAELQAAKQATVDSMNVEIAKQEAIDSMKFEMARLENQKRAKEVVVVHEPNAAAPATVAETPKKRKMSGAAKGALIGAGVGAITGAIVSEKKGQGAIIGGLAGAGVGAGTGAIIDNEKKKKEAQEQQK